MEDTGDITATVEIVAILRQLVKGRELLTAAFNHGRNSMTTLLLEVEPNRGVFLCDASRDEAINDAIVAAPAVAFSGALHGVKVSFSAGGGRRLDYRGSAALSLRLPSSLRRAQNRAAFRVNTSVASCTLPVPGRGRIGARLSEVSAGGAQVVLNYAAADQFIIGQVIPACEIDLGGIGRFSVDLEVRSIKRLADRTVGMGCRFRNLSRGHEALVARFVAHQERQVISRRGFFDL